VITGTVHGSVWILWEKMLRWLQLSHYRGFEPKVFADRIAQIFLSVWAGTGNPSLTSGTLHHSHPQTAALQRPQAVQYAYSSTHTVTPSLYSVKQKALAPCSTLFLLLKIPMPLALAIPSFSAVLEQVNPFCVQYSTSGRTHGDILRLFGIRWLKPLRRHSYNLCALDAVLVHACSTEKKNLAQLCNALM